MRDNNRRAGEPVGSDRGVPDGRPAIVGEVLFDVFPDGARILGGAPLNVAQTEILSSFSIATLPKPWQEADLTEALSSIFLGSGSLSRQPLPEESRGKAVPVPTRVADSRREAADNVNKE